MKDILRFTGRILFGLLLGFAAAVAVAQSYPGKPIKMIVPYTPGTGIDILARTIGQKLTEKWGQPVVVENKPGASGNIGTDAVAKAAPDGYTLVMTSNPFVINPSLYKNVPYDPVKSFSPIIEVAYGTLALTVNPSVPADTVKDLIALAKSQPGKIFYGSPGNGTPHHMATELFKIMTGVNMVHVPYKGSAGAVTDVVSGEVGVMFMPVHVALPFVKGGKLKALAVSSARRSPVAPNVPTMAEAGVPGHDVEMWYGLLAPAGTPRDIIARVNGEIINILKMPDVREGLVKQGLEPISTTPEQFATVIRTDLARWAKVVKDAGITAD